MLNIPDIDATQLPTAPKRTHILKDLTSLRLLMSDEAGHLREVSVDTAVSDASHFATISDAYAKGCPFTNVRFPWPAKLTSRSQRRARLYPFIATIRSVQYRWNILPEHSGTVFIPPSYVSHPDLKDLVSKPSFVSDFAAAAQSPCVAAQHTAFARRPITYRDFPECPLCRVAAAIGDVRVWSAVAARYKRSRLLNAIGHLRKGSLATPELVRYERLAKDWPVLTISSLRNEPYKALAEQLIQENPLLSSDLTGAYLRFETPSDAFLFFDPILEKKEICKEKRREIFC